MHNAVELGDSQAHSLCFLADLLNETHQITMFFLSKLHMFFFAFVDFLAMLPTVKVFPGGSASPQQRLFGGKFLIFVATSRELLNFATQQPIRAKFQGNLLRLICREQLRLRTLFAAYCDHFAVK